MDLKKTRQPDIRFGKVLGILERFSCGDFSFRAPFDPDGDEFDMLVEKLNELGEKIRQSGKIISGYEKRVSAIMDVLMKYTLFDFSEKAGVSESGDELDAIALALNTLGEELHDRIQAEKRYTQRLEQVAVVMETTAEGILSMDPECVITTCNKSAEKIYGYKMADMIGRLAWDLLVDREQAAEAKSLLSRVKQGEQILNYETRRINGKKEVLEISLSLTPIFAPNGRLAGISAVSRDITEQKNSERELRHSEERFRSLVEGVKDYAIIMLDPGGLISSWNMGATTIHSFTEREATGQHFSVFFTGDDRKLHLPGQLLKEAIRNGNAVRDLYLLKKDGSTFWANLLVTCLRDAGGQMSGFSMITRDLTESRQKDEEISLYTRQLEQKNLELEKINKELSSFTYIASHDLQEPLRKIRTLTSRLLQTDFDNLSEGGKDYFRRMESSASRMQLLIRDIIDYTSLSTGDNICETCNLHELLKEVIAKFSEQLQVRGGKIEVKELCAVDVIPHQFSRLMYNLISNSLKFASEKRAPYISIQSYMAEGPVPGVKNASPRHCVLEVKDNGIGFEPHFNRQIFEVFQRLHSQELYPGTGIGLAICKKIVENHHGTIEAIGELGKGTVIRVCLPPVKPEKKA